MVKMSKAKREELFRERLEYLACGAAGCDVIIELEEYGGDERAEMINCMSAGGISRFAVAVKDTMMPNSSESGLSWEYMFKAHNFDKWGGNFEDLCDWLWGIWKENWKP